MPKPNLLDEFREKLIIDEHNLDQEIKYHSSLFYRVGELYVKAKMDSDACQSIISDVSAKLDEQIREEHTEKEKLKEREIKARIENTTEMKKARAAYAEAKHRTDKLSTLKESYIQRGYQLTNMTQLHSVNYYNSSDSKTYKQVRDVHDEEVRKDLSEQRKKKFKRAERGD